MPDKRTTVEEIVGELRDGMTVGIGGWGSRRKPMAVIRAILRSPVTDLTVVSYGGPDVGLLCAAGKVRKVVFAFVSLDSIALEPHFRNARQAGSIDSLATSAIRQASSSSRGCDSLLGQTPTWCSITRPFCPLLAEPGRRALRSPGPGPCPRHAVTHITSPLT